MSALRMRFDPDDRITVRGVPYCVTSSDADGHHVMDDKGRCDHITHEGLAAVKDRNEYIFEPGYFSENKAALRGIAGTRLVSEQPAKTASRLMLRLFYVERFLELERDRKVCRTYPDIQRVIDDVIVPAHSRLNAEQVRNGLKPRGGRVSKKVSGYSARTVLKWVTDYEKAGSQPLCLKDNYDRSGWHGSRMAADAAALMLKIVLRYAEPEQPSKVKICGDVERAFERENEARAAAHLPLLEVPSDKAVKKAIKRLDPFWVCARRYGLDHAKKEFAWIGGGVKEDHPMHRVEIDEWEVDLQTLLVQVGVWEAMGPEERSLVERVRMWLSAAIDVATRCIVGMRLSRTSSVEAMIATLEMCGVDKGEFSDAVGAASPWRHHGGTKVFVVDQGSSHIAEPVRQAIADMGATVEYPPAGTPAMRARIERFFGTLAHTLMERLAGRTFSNVVRKGAYPAEERAALTVDQLAWVLVRWTVDAYHNSPHEGLGGETPDNAWTRLTVQNGVPPTMDAHTRRSIFGLKVKAKLTGRGIRVLGNYYRSDWLADRFLHSTDRNFEVRLARNDIGTISVRVGNGPFRPVACVASGFDGVALSNYLAAQHLLRRKYKRDGRYSRGSLFRALDEIDNVNAHSMAIGKIARHLESEEEVEMAERLLFSEYEMTEDVEAGATDHLPGEIIAPVKDVLPALAKPAGRMNEKPAKPKNWSME